jgi:hypothetical protein
VLATFRRLGVPVTWRRRAKPNLLSTSRQKAPKLLRLRGLLEDGLGVGRNLAKARSMPNQKTKEQAKRDLAEGKSPSTAAGEFVREEVHHVREGKHGVKNTKQAIAIGLSKARRAGVPSRPSATASSRTKRKAAQDSARAGKQPNPRRSAASRRARKKEGASAVSSTSLSRQAKRSAATRRRQGGKSSPTLVARRAAQTRKRSGSHARTNA